MRLKLPLWVVALALLAGGTWAGSLGRLHVTGTASVIDRFEAVLLDLRIQLKGHRAPPDAIAVVVIDDDAIGADGGFPQGRLRLARILGAIRDAGARAIAIDMLLFGRTDPASDAALAQAIGAGPAVLAAAAQFGEDPPPVAHVPYADNLLFPDALFEREAPGGFVNVATDAGGTPRHVPLVFRTPDGVRPSFALQAVSVYLGETPALGANDIRFGAQTLSLDLGWHMALNYHGPEGTIRQVSAGDLLDGTEPATVLKDKLVVLGVTATAVGDRFSTPFDPVLPGVVVQATAIANLLDGSFLVRDSGIRWIDAAAAMTVTILGILAVVLLPLAPATLLCGLLLACWLTMTGIFFFQNIWLNGALPLAASLPPLAALVILRQTTDRYQTRRHIKAHEALRRFQSPLLAGHIADDPDFLSQPRQLTAAILFIDLSGFTGLSERLGAAATRDVLKEFHTIVVNQVSRGDGVVLDFMGDGAMLGFGIPDQNPSGPAAAFRCAFDLQREVTEWIGASRTEARIDGVRVGAHFGDVVLSRLGHDDQQQIAATGDCVNVASRLLEVAKDNQAAVVVSSELIDAASRAGLPAAEAPGVKTVILRGRRKSLEVGLWTSDDIRSMPSEQPAPPVSGS